MLLASAKAMLVAFNGGNFHKFDTWFYSASSLN